MANKQIIRFYRNLYSDLSVSRDENEEICQTLTELNPPPDKLVWLRATAFRIGSEYLSDDDDDDGKEANVSLLKCINTVVHAIEITCMTPSMSEEDDDEEEESSSFNGESFQEYVRECLGDLSVDREESKELFEFFSGTNRPTRNKLIWTRAAIFRIGSEFLTEDHEMNVALLKCLNHLVHAFEMVCLKPKEFELKEEFSTDISLSEAVQHLWNLDVNRLEPNEDYAINVQGGKKPYWKEDCADDALFSFVDPHALRRPTYKAFIALLDNYTAQVGEGETVTSSKRRENFTFLDAIMQSAPMQYCHKYCIANGDCIPSDPADFKNLLYKIWFELYRRGGSVRDSSGFEHVFVGEIKHGKVSGFHNWIHFFIEERKGNIDYRGYIKPKGNYSAHENSDDHILTLQFEWDGVLKSVGTSFIGVSPEFEMALYSMCFLTGEEENIIDLDTGSDSFKLVCKVFTMARDKIGTSFVEVLEHED